MADQEVQEVNQDNMAAVLLWPDELTSELKAWRQKSSAFISSHCECNMWFGSVDDFMDFPTEGLEDYQVKFGNEAYALVASFAAGITVDEIDTHDRHQFERIYTDMCLYNPEKAERFHSIIRQINEDISLIDKQWLRHHNQPNYILAARDLSDQKKEDRALLVAGLDDEKRLTAETARMINALSLHKSRHASTLTITHPDPELLDKVRDNVERLHQNRTVRSNIEFVAFDDVSQEIERNDRIYICSSMGAYPEADNLLIEGWRGRVNRNNTLTHVTGCREDEGQSNDSWKSASLDNYVGPEDICEELIEREEENKALIRRANEGFLPVRVCGPLATGLPEQRLSNQHLNCLVRSEN